MYKKALQHTIYSILTIVCLFSIAHPVHATVQELTGYAWSDGIGWISMNCKNHEVPDAIGGPACGTPYQVNYDDVTGWLTGYAWSDNAGWLNFNTSPPFTYAPGSGNPAQPPQITGSPTKFTRGWARFCTPLDYAMTGCTGNQVLSIINGTGLGGWDGWVSLGGTTGGGGTYSATIDQSTGQFSGYWWGGNEHVGWISLNQVKIEGTDPDLQLRLINYIKNSATGVVTPNTFSPWVTNSTPLVATGAPDMTIPATVTTISGVNYTSFMRAEWVTTGLNNCTGSNYNATSPAYNITPSGAFPNTTNGGVTVLPGANQINNNANGAAIRRAYTLTCTNSFGLTVTKTATFDVLSSAAAIHLDANPFIFLSPTGATATLSWWGTNVDNCFASIDKTTGTSPDLALVNGGIPGWDNNYHPSPVNAMPTPLAQKPVSLPFSISPGLDIKSINFKITCNSTVSNGKPLTATKIVQLGEQTIPIINLVASKFVSGAPVLPASKNLTVNVGDKIQLDWNTNNTGYDWYNGGLGYCTANSGTNDWKTLPAIKLTTTSTILDRWQAPVDIPVVGTSLFYNITCYNGAGAQATDVVKVTTNDVAKNNLELRVLDTLNTPKTNLTVPITTTNVDLVWQSNIAGLTNCKGVTGYGATPFVGNGWQGQTLLPLPVTTGYSSPPYNAPINTTVGNTLFKMQCQGLTGIVSSNIVTITSYDPANPDPTAVLSCGAWDGVNQKELSWDCGNSDDWQLNINGSAQSLPSSSGTQTFTITSTLPHSVFLKCTDTSKNPDKSATDSKTIQPNGSCTAGPKGGVKPKWIQF